MELGEKLRQARLDAGLSQRALCGDTITRNMLSQIEHGTARPSMATLQILAARLGKPVSYFLQEDVTASPNLKRMEQARACLDAGDFSRGLEVLRNYQSPDGLFDREQALLLTLLQLGLAAQCLATHREPYARELLEGIVTEGVYCGEDLDRRRLLLLAKLGPAELPSLDEELLIRAEQARNAGDLTRAGHLLQCAEDRETPEWNLLRGQIHLAQNDFQAAAICLRRAETAFPAETLPLLEQCFRELGDYKSAYECACKQRADTSPVEEGVSKADERGMATHCILYSDQKEGKPLSASPSLIRPRLRSATFPPGEGISLISSAYVKGPDRLPQSGPVLMVLYYFIKK